MKLVDMKLPKKTKKEMEDSGVTSMEDQEEYPYGLRLRFDKNEVAKLSVLKGVQAGDMCEIVGKGKVTEVSVTDSAKGNKRHNVEIQIQQVGITPEKEPQNMNMQEYAAFRNKKM